MAARSCLSRARGYPVGRQRFTTWAGAQRPAAEDGTFVDLCDTFHIPIINFVDQRHGGGASRARRWNVRGSVRVVSAIEQSKVPWCAVVIRPLRPAGTARTHAGINLHYAWPSGRWGSIPFEGGIAAAYRRELDALPEAERAARLAELDVHYERLASPFLTAEKFRVPDIIDPRDTRRVLCHWIEDAWRMLPEQLGPRGRTMRK
jgi:acetyl-CoA carboxylase carboxyltransferase component